MRDLTRRDALGLIIGAAATACVDPGPPPEARLSPRPARLGEPGANAILRVSPLGARWATSDPFIACMHHDDRYPAGNAQLGPASSLSGRQIGRDFDPRQAWRMYHGDVVPGFPQHPHRGFETVTVVRRGLLDHSDSLGATARYGGGDVQWLTAGRGILHAEMFPLLERRADNPLELFQIWLNLPAADKMVEPEFAMLWNERILRRVLQDDSGASTEVTVMAGEFDGTRAPAPPRHSWASRPDSDLAIWTIRLAPNARWELPAAQPRSARSLYFHEGTRLRAGGHDITGGHRIELHADRAVTLENGGNESELLLLQGRPIGEPVVQRGPFVMNTEAEIRTAYADYRRTSFGGWPWPSNDPVHGDTPTRFARLSDGRLLRPG